MNLRRLALSVIALGLLALFVTEAAAQRDGGKPPINAAFVDGYTCPNCDKDIPAPDGAPPATCPHCKVKLTAVDAGNGTYNLTYTEVNENKWRKPLVYGGGALLVLGLIGVALKYTVFKAPPPKKKKKKRRDDDEEEERPRKKKRPVVEDEDERPRRKKPRIVEDDDE